jgi:hypothetical protein
MDTLPNVVVRTADKPSLCRQDQPGGTGWVLEFGDAGVAVILDDAQVRTINDDYLSQMLGGPFEDAGE